MSRDYRTEVHTLPAHMQESILHWIESPLPPRLLGHFLRALLSNDLMEAFARADDQNAAAMRAWVSYLYNWAPSPCYGSPEKVQTWWETHPRRHPPRDPDGL